MKNRYYMDYQSVGNNLPHRWETITRPSRRTNIQASYSRQKRHLHHRCGLLGKWMDTHTERCQTIQPTFPKSRNIQAHTRNRQYRFSVDNRRPAFFIPSGKRTQRNRPPGFSQPHRRPLWVARSSLVHRNPEAIAFLQRRQRLLHRFSAGKRNLAHQQILPISRRRFVDTRRTR